MRIFCIGTRKRPYYVYRKTKESHTHKNFNREILCIISIKSCVIYGLASDSYILIIYVFRIFVRKSLNIFRFFPKNYDSCCRHKNSGYPRPYRVIQKQITFLKKCILTNFKTFQLIHHFRLLHIILENIIKTG